MFLVISWINSPDFLSINSQALTVKRTAVQYQQKYTEMAEADLKTEQDIQENLEKEKQEKAQKEEAAKAAKAAKNSKA